MNCPECQFIIYRPKHSATGRRTAQREVLSLFESMLSIAKTPDKKTDSNSESDNLSAIQETESEHLTSFNMEEETPSAADEVYSGASEYRTLWDQPFCPL